MAIVGPSGSGETELVLKLFIENIFYPKYRTVIYLHKEMQPAFSAIMSSREVEMKFNSYESVRNSENVLLVLDDSCEDIYNDKELVR